MDAHKQTQTHLPIQTHINSHTETVTHLQTHVTLHQTHRHRHTHMYTLPFSLSIFSLSLSLFPSPFPTFHSTPLLHKQTSTIESIHTNIHTPKYHTYTHSLPHTHTLSHTHTLPNPLHLIAAGWSPEGNRAAVSFALLSRK